MRKVAITGWLIASALVVLAVGSYAVAADDEITGGALVRMESYFEVPSISSVAPDGSAGQGEFRWKLDKNREQIEYSLTWSVEVSATQAHIHIGQRSVNGGISVFLCTNLCNAPPSPPNPPTQACPVGPTGTITGVITRAHVIGPTSQGVEPGAWEELVAAMEEGFAYANVHSARFPGGEVRGQIGANRGDNTGARAHDLGP
jgi:hypothetical protein